MPTGEPSKPLKAYIYKPEEVGLTKWPDGLLRVEGTETVDDPTQADIFICPGPLCNGDGYPGFTEPHRLERFPYMAGNEARHVFFDISDGFSTIYDKPCLFIRCNLKTWMKARDLNSVSWPWPVDDYPECVDLPEGGFKYDVSFHGWRLSSSRLESTASCEQSDLTTDFVFHPDFTGKYLPRGQETAEGWRRRKGFVDSMRQCRVSLCPEQIPGDFPYRFFEAMSAGRIPVMVGSDYILPFADEIPYDSFILEISRNDAANSGAIIQEFLRGKSDHELHLRGLMARHYWQQWLSREEWSRTIRYVVDKHMKTL